MELLLSLVFTFHILDFPYDIKASVTKTGGRRDIYCLNFDRERKTEFFIVYFQMQIRRIVEKKNYCFRGN